MSVEIEARSQQVDDGLPDCHMAALRTTWRVSFHHEIHPFQLLMQKEHAEMVAAVLKLRLRPDGTALVALAIRDEVCPFSHQGTDKPHLTGDRSRSSSNSRLWRAEPHA